MESIKIYENIIHIGDNRVMVIPQGVDKMKFAARLKTEKVVNSGIFTKSSGREYCNFAPMVVECEIETVTLDEIAAMKW